MIELSPEFTRAFDRRLERAAVPVQEHPDYRKWVRFYLDFCRKYAHPPRAPTSLDPFLAKLESKGQSPAQRGQAAQAVKLLLATPGTTGTQATAKTSRPNRVVGERVPGIGAGRPPGDTPRSKTCNQAKPPLVGARNNNQPPPPTAGHGTSWEREYRELEGAIRLRNYSYKTWDAYRSWLQKFQAFVRSRSTSELGSAEVKEFLTDLAVRHQVAASTQNQAFNALLFFYRHVLGREFGKLDGVVRAKRRPYVPVDSRKPGARSISVPHQSRLA